MAVQFYAYGSLFTPLYPDYMTEGGGDALITRGYKRGVTRICQPIAVRTQGGLKADCRRRGGLSNSGTFCGGSWRQFPWATVPSARKLGKNINSWRWHYCANFQVPDVLIKAARPIYSLHVYNLHRIEPRF